MRPEDRQAALALPKIPAYGDLPRDKIHVFVADRGLCQGEGDDSREIIVDPAWTQFFEPWECLFPDSRAEFRANGGTCDPDDALTRLPLVFVGTRAELVEAYTSTEGPPAQRPE